MRDPRRSLRSRYTALDAHLRSPATTRLLATLVGGLLVVQGAVVVGRTGDGTTAPEIAALEPADGASASPTADGSAPEAGATPLVADAAGPAGPRTDATDDGATRDGATGDGGTTDGGTTDGGTTDGGTTDGGGEGTAAGATGAATAPPPPSASSDRAAATSTSTAPASDPARQRFESRFPDQARAGQSAARPDTTRWAVLIGVNDHSGRTRDNVGSRQDAEDLARHLRSLGWRDDHVVLLTDAAATREHIIEALRWLRRKTNDDSVVVVHYSGHVKQWPGRDVDGDGETTDEALWPSDNRFIPDGELGGLLGRIHHDRMWFNVGGCEAAGFNDWGIPGPDRLVTWSSAEHQKSYEDPRAGNSIWGRYLIEEGMIAGHGDADGDGNVTVEEAYRYAGPRADRRTRGQSHGRQTPQVSDRFTGEFDLRIPPPRPRSQPAGSDDGGSSCLLCPPAPSASLRWR